ncbi:hypothetical protein DQT32_04345 [Salmonella enterica subsp. enterica serovar Braenderup]|nr:hypothetical protein [Salmonella enterica subsp. enterica serovar Braenderup]
MSLFDVTINGTGVGNAGTTKMLVAGFFPHMSDAREKITEFATETFVSPFDINIEFVSHSNTIFPADVLQYERIVIIE